MFGTTVLTIPSNLVVQGNYIGTKADGLTPLGNGNHGLDIHGPNSIIGGAINTSPGGACTGACNLIAGNTGSGLRVGSQFDFATGSLFSAASGTVVEGNYIGVNLTGSQAIPNSWSGIEVSAPGVIIGGFSAAARNVISGNDDGVSFFASSYGPGNTAVPGGTGAGGFVRGNFIGANAAGNAPMPNWGSGVRSMVPNVTIGGPESGAVNVIAAGPSLVSASTLVFIPFGATIVSAATGTIIQMNHIDTDLTGTLRLSQGTGCVLRPLPTTRFSAT